MELLYDYKEIGKQLFELKISKVELSFYISQKKAADFDAKLDYKILTNRQMPLLISKKISL